jgi:hypothetical protein
MRKETDNRRPQRRDDNRRPEKREDNRRPEKREESREKRRPEKRDDNRRPTEEKIEKEISAPCSPISLPPREYFMDAPIDYGDLSKSIPKRKLTLLKKKTPPVPVAAPLPVAEKKTVELEIEEGEVVDQVVEMSEADKKSYDELYGDL